MTSLSPRYISISQPRYLPAINYLQRIYHSDTFILLDDCQHQRRAFEHRNKVLTIDHSSRKEPKWLSLTIDRTEGSRPKICDLKLKSLIADLELHGSIIAKAYGLHSLSYDGFFTTCIKQAELLIESNSFVEFIEYQLLSIFDFVNIKLPTRLVRSSEIKGEGSGSCRLLECCIDCGGTAYISGPNGREYLSSPDFERMGLQVFCHEFTFPVYAQIGTGPFVPWMAWIDMLYALGREGVSSLIKEPPSLNRM